MGSNDPTMFVNIDKVTGLEKELRALYCKLGKAYYEGGFEDPLPELLPLFDKITGLRAEMKKTAEILEEKVLKCPACGAEVGNEDKFCGVCGRRLK